MVPSAVAGGISLNPPDLFPRLLGRPSSTTSRGVLKSELGGEGAWFCWNLLKW